MWVRSSSCVISLLTRAIVLEAAGIGRYFGRILAWVVFAFIRRDIRVLNGQLALCKHLLRSSRRTRKVLNCFLSPDLLSQGSIGRSVGFERSSLGMKEPSLSLDRIVRRTSQKQAEYWSSTCQVFSQLRRPLPESPSFQASIDVAFCTVKHESILYT